MAKAGRVFRGMITRSTTTTSAPQQRQAAIKTAQTTRLLKLVKKRRRLGKTGLRMAGAEEMLARRMEAAAVKYDRVVQRGIQQNTAMQQEMQKRQQLLGKRQRNVQESQQAAVDQFAKKERAKRLKVNASQANAALKNDRTNLLQNIARVNANLKIEAFELKRSAAKFQRKRQLAKQTTLRQVRNFKRKRNSMATELGENVANAKTNAQYRLQQQQVQQALNRTGAQVYRANALTAQKRARLAAQLSPIEQQANAWAGSGQRQSKVYRASIQPLMNQRPASSYLALRRNAQPISRSWQIT